MINKLVTLCWLLYRRFVVKCYRRKFRTQSMPSQWLGKSAPESMLCRRTLSKWSRRWWWRSLRVSWSVIISRSHSA